MRILWERSDPGHFSSAFRVCRIMPCCVQAWSCRRFFLGTAQARGSPKSRSREVAEVAMFECLHRLLLYDTDCGSFPFPPFPSGVNRRSITWWHS